MPPKRILLLGGAYPQIPIIKEAKSRGYYVITCDYLPDNPGHKFADEYYNVSTTDFKKVLQLAEYLRPDYVVAYASDPAAPVAAYVSEILGLPGNSYQSMRLLSEKDLFRKFLKDNGFNAPNAVSIKIDDNYISKIEGLKLPIIIKPTDSSGSKGISMVNDYLNLEEVIAYAFKFSRNNRLIAEEFIRSRGEQLHGDGFVKDGELIFTYLGNHYYNVEINPFVPYATLWPSDKGKNLVRSVEDEVGKIIKKSGYRNGPVNIEARIDPQGKIFIMEIGPRSGGNFVPQVINYATGFDMVKATLDILSGNDLEVNTYDKGCYKYAAYYVVHSEHNGTLKNLSLHESLLPFIKEFHQYIKIGEEVKSFQGANAAIGIILMLFETREKMNHFLFNMKDLVDLKVQPRL